MSKTRFAIELVVRYEDGVEQVLDKIVLFRDPGKYPRSVTILCGHREVGTFDLRWPIQEGPVQRITLELKV